MGWEIRGPQSHVPPPLDPAAPSQRGGGGGAEWGRARRRQRLRQVSAPQPIPIPVPAHHLRGDRLPRHDRAPGSSARPAQPCPPPPRRDPWAPAPDAPRFGPGAAGVLRGSAVSPARVGERVRGAQQQRRARRGPPRSAPARPPRRAPPACPALPLRPPPRAEPRPRPPHAREPAEAEAGAGPRLRSPLTPRGGAWWHRANPRGDLRLI